MLSTKNIEKILAELEGISATYKVPVADLVNKLVESAIVENTYVDENGAALTLDQVKALIMKGLDKVALATAKEDIKELTTEAELPKVEFNEEIAPRGYSSVIPQAKDNGLKMKDGRIYQETGNGYGMFLDNGSVFKL